MTKRRNIRLVRALFVVCMTITAISAAGNAQSPGHDNVASAKVAEATAKSYSNAKKLRVAARAYAQKGDIKSAYQATVIAWQSIRKEKSHQPTQELAADLCKEMEEYGEQLESPRIRNVLSKPVRYE